MKRLFGVFVLTPAEQRVVIFIVLLLVAGAGFKHYRDLKYRPPPSNLISPSPADH